MYGILLSCLVLLVATWRCWYYFGRCSYELAELVPLPYCRRRSTGYFYRLHDFSVTIPRCYKDVYINSLFTGTARLWDSVPLEYFPLTYDLSGFKSLKPLALIF